jgi:hypothetical protein
MNFYTDVNVIVYRDKKTGDLIGGTEVDYKITEIPWIACPISASGNYFISAYLPSKNDLFLSESSVISDEDKIKIKNLTEDDNPVLAFFTLKDF